jgi:hypothetical protein
MIYFWKGNTALFVKTFFERGRKKDNRREYETANKIKNAVEGRR